MTAIARRKLLAAFAGAAAAWPLAARAQALAHRPLIMEGGTAQAAAFAAAASGDFAGLIDIGGRRLHLACKGSGSPTVILEAGAGGNGDTWSMWSATTSPALRGIGAGSLRLR